MKIAYFIIVICTFTICTGVARLALRLLHCNQLSVYLIWVQRTIVYNYNFGLAWHGRIFILRSMSHGDLSCPITGGTAGCYWISYKLKRGWLGVKCLSTCYPLGLFVFLPSCLPIAYMPSCMPHPCVGLSPPSFKQCPGPHMFQTK